MANYEITTKAGATYQLDLPDAMSETEIMDYFNNRYLPSLEQDTVNRPSLSEPSGDLTQFNAPVEQPSQATIAQMQAEANPKDTSDFSRGFKTSYEQLPELGYGLEAGAYAIGESAFGEGGMLTQGKQEAVAKMIEAQKETQANAKESDSFTFAYEKAKQGDFNALADTVQYGLGYGLGQMSQAVITGGLGSTVAKTAAETFAKEYTAKLVEQEALKVAEQTAARELTQEQIQQQAVKNVAESIANKGRDYALGAQAVGLEGGEILGDLAKQSTEQNRSLTAGEVTKGLGATALAAAGEFYADRFGLDILGGKRLSEAGKYTEGLKGNLLRGAATGVKGGFVEGGTEFAQTLIEEAGKGKDPFSSESFRQAIDAAALGSIGGGGIGAIGGALSPAQQRPDQPATGEIDPSMLSGGLPNSTAQTTAQQPAQTSSKWQDTMGKIRGIVGENQLVDNETIAKDVMGAETIEDAIAVASHATDAIAFDYDMNMEQAATLAQDLTKTDTDYLDNKDYQDAVQLENQLSTVRDQLAYNKFQTAFEESNQQASRSEFNALVEQEISNKNQQLKDLIQYQSDERARKAEVEASIPSINKALEDAQWAKTRNNRNAVIQMVFDRNVPAENIFSAIKAELKRQGFKDTEINQDDIDSYNLLKAYDQNNFTIAKEPVSFGGQPVAARSASDIEFYNTGTNKVDKQGNIIADALGKQGANAGEQFTGGQGQDVVTNFVSPETPVRQESDALRKVDEWVRNGATYKNGMLIDSKGKKFLLNKAQREYYSTNKSLLSVAKSPVALTEQGYSETQQGQDTITGAPSFNTRALKEVLDIQIKERVDSNRENRNLSSVNQRIEEQQWAKTRNNRNAAIQTVFDKNVSASNIFPAIKAELKRQGFKDTELSEDDINAYELLQSAYARRNPEIANEPVDIGVQQPVSSKRVRLVRQGVNAGEQVTEGQQGQDVVTNFVEPSTPVRQESDALRKVDEWLRAGAIYKNGMLIDSKGKKFLLNKVQREYYLENRATPIVNAPVDMGEVGNAPRKRYMGVKQQGVNAGEQMTSSIGQDQISGVEEEQATVQPVAKKKPAANNLRAITGLEPIEVVIGKLGGINREIANREGFSDFKGWYFTKTSSQSFDGMAEILRGYDFDVSGGNDLVTQLRQSLDAKLFGMGQQVYTFQGLEHQMALEQAEEFKAFEAEQKELAKELSKVASGNPTTIEEIQAAETPEDFDKLLTNIVTLSEDEADDFWNSIGEENADQTTKDASIASIKENAPEILSTYTQQEVTQREEAQKAAEKEQAVKDAAAERKRQADNQVDSVVDEMLGRGMTTTNDIFAPERKGKVVVGREVTVEGEQLANSGTKVRELYPNHWFYGDKGAQDKFNDTEIDYEGEYPNLESISLINTDSNIGGFYDQVERAIYQTTQSDRTTLHELGHAVHHQLLNYRKLTENERVILKEMILGDEQANHPYLASDKELVAEFNLYAHLFPVKAKAYAPELYKELVAGRKEVVIKLGSQESKGLTQALKQANVTIEKGYGEEEEPYTVEDSNKEISAYTKKEYVKQKLASNPKGNVEEITKQAEREHRAAIELQVAQGWGIYGENFEDYRDIWEKRNSLKKKYNEKEAKARYTSKLKESSLENRRNEILKKIDNPSDDKTFTDKFYKQIDSLVQYLGFEKFKNTGVFTIFKNNKDDYLVFNNPKNYLDYPAMVAFDKKGNVLLEGNIRDFAKALSMSIFGENHKGLSENELKQIAGKIKEVYGDLSKLSDIGWFSKYSPKNINEFTYDHHLFGYDRTDIFKSEMSKAIPNLIKPSSLKFSKARVSKSDDAKYLAAVEAGDMETAQEMVNIAAENAGYGMSDYQMSHEAPNRNDYPINDLTTIYPEDIYSSSAVNYYGDGQPSDSEAIAKLQRMRGKKPNAAIMVYRAVPNDVKESMPRNGDWVSTTRAYAEEHGKRWLPNGYRVMEIVTTVGNIFTDGNSIHELGFDDGKEYGYANTKNNRKLIDAVTYDDDANVIPLSKRFNKRSDDVRFSQAQEPTVDNHTEQSLKEGLTQAGDDAYGKGWTDRLLATGMFEFISDADAQAIVEEAAEVSYSKNGDIEAFFNPAEGKTYFVAENIDKATDLHYLMMHEVSVHMLNMGANKEEFEKFLKATDNLVKVKNPAAMQGRQDALDADTPQEDLREETLAYLVKYVPKLKVVQQFKAWLKNALRNMSKSFPAAQRLGFIQWANNLSDQDLLYIAEATLRKAPEMLSKQTQYQSESDAILAAKAENRSLITGNLERLKDDNPDAHKAIMDYLDRLPEDELQRVSDNLEEFKGTPWAMVAIKSMVIKQIYHLSENYKLNKDAIDKLIVGSLWRKDNISRYATLKVFLINDPVKRNEAIQLLGKTYDFVGDNRKAENDIAGSFVNCNPSKACAEHCYAALKNATPAELLKAEYTEYMSSSYPQIIADRIYDQYSITAAFKEKLTLRLNDKGELSDSQLNVIKLLNEKGIDLQVFSKRPELLKQVNDRNLKMLSIDTTNFDLALNNPEFKLAITLTDDFTPEMIAQVDDRVSVYLPVNLKGKEWSREKLREMYPEKYKDMSKRICPVDSENVTTKKGTSFVQVLNKEAKGLWTCTTCDKLGTVGCFKGFNTEKTAKYVSASSIGNLSKEKALAKKQDDISSMLSEFKQMEGIDNDTYRKIVELLSKRPSELSESNEQGGDRATENQNIKQNGGNIQEGTGVGETTGATRTSVKFSKKAKEGEIVNRSTGYTAYENAKPIPEEVDNKANYPEGVSLEEERDWLMQQLRRFDSFRRLNDKSNELINKYLTTMGRLPELGNYLGMRYQTLGKIDNVDDIVRNVFDTLQKATKEDSKEIYTYLTDNKATTEFIIDPQMALMAKDLKEAITIIGKKLVEFNIIPMESFQMYEGRYLPRVYLEHIIQSSDRYQSLGSGKTLSPMGYAKRRDNNLPEEFRRLIKGEIKNTAYLASRTLSIPLRDIAMMEFFNQISDNEKWVWKQSLINIELDAKTNRPTAIFDDDGVINYKATNSALEGAPKKIVIRKVTPYFLDKEADRILDQSYSAPEEDRKDMQDLAKMMKRAASQAMVNMDAVPADFMKMPNIAKYGSLRGLVVHKLIYDDLVGTINTYGAAGEQTALENFFGNNGILAKITNAFKFSHVAINIPTQVTNLLSNGLLLHMSGVRFDKVPVRVTQAFKEVLNDGENYKKMIAMGGRKATFSNQELSGITEWLLENEAEFSDKNTDWFSIVHIMRELSYLTGKTVRGANNLHQNIEMVFKVAKFIDMKAKGANDETAAVMAHQALFDYSFIPRWAKWLRTVPMGIPFITWTIKSFEATLRTAANRPTTFLPYYMLGYAMSLAAGADFGDDGEDKLKAILKLLPERMQRGGSIWILPIRDDAGRTQLIDMKNLFPWGKTAEAIDSLSKLVGNQDVAELRNLADSVGVFSSPITQAVVAIDTNKDAFTGKQIVDENDPPAAKLQSILEYTYGMMSPPMLGGKGDIATLIKSQFPSQYEGIMNKDGSPKKTEQQAFIHLFTGLSIKSVDSEFDRHKKIEAFNSMITGIKAQRTRELRSNPNLSEESRRIVREKYDARIERVKEKKQKFKDETDVLK